VTLTRRIIKTLLPQLFSQPEANLRLNPIEVESDLALGTIGILDDERPPTAIPVVPRRVMQGCCVRKRSA
jgi:hypothetical protein